MLNARALRQHCKCQWGDRCQFAHGAQELKNRPRHNKYKTELCKTFVASGGECPYGQRCHFIHAFTMPETPLTMPPANGARDSDDSKASRGRDDGGVQELSPATNASSPVRLAEFMPRGYSNAEKIRVMDF